MSVSLIELWTWEQRPYLFFFFSNGEQIEHHLVLAWCYALLFERMKTRKKRKCSSSQPFPIPHSRPSLSPPLTLSTLLCVRGTPTCLQSPAPFSFLAGWRHPGTVAQSLSVYNLLVHSLSSPLHLLDSEECRSSGLSQHTVIHLFNILTLHWFLFICCPNKPRSSWKEE